MPGYLKSASLAGQTVPPGGFQIAPGATGPLRSRWAANGRCACGDRKTRPPDRQVSALIFPEDSSRLGIGLERAGVMANGSVDFGGLAPGRYRVFATDSPNPGSSCKGRTG
jgi:hypothetical protein